MSTHEAVDETVSALSVGSVIGGLTEKNRDWQKAISSLSDRLEELSEGVTVPVNINVVFHIPGNFIQPEFDGIRTGSYSKQRSLLMIQVALPEAAPIDPLPMLARSVSAALDAAEIWGRRRRVAMSLAPLREMTATL